MLQPVLHGMDGFKVLRRRMDGHFFPLRLHHNDRRDRKNVDTLSGLNGYFHEFGMIQVQSVIQIPEQTLPVYGLGQVAEDMEPHGFVQIFGIFCSFSMISKSSSQIRIRIVHSPFDIIDAYGLFRARYVPLASLYNNRIKKRMSFSPIFAFVFAFRFGRDVSLFEM